MGLVADDAGPGIHRTVHVLALGELLPSVTAKTQAAGGILNQEETLVAAMWIVAAGAVAAGNRLMHDVPHVLDVAAGAESRLGHGEGKPMLRGVAEYMA